MEHNGKLVFDYWKKNDKVKALRKMIKCMKFLCPQQDPSFMAVKFVTVLDVFQKFSELVFSRFKVLAFPKLNEAQLRGLSNQRIIDNDAPVLAVSTCRNWIEKCVQTRELIPRMYSPMSPSPFPIALLRPCSSRPI